jgi:hypothetical protein
MTGSDAEILTLLVTSVKADAGSLIVSKIEEAGEGYVVVPIADDQNAPRLIGALPRLDVAVIDTSTVGAPHKTDLIQKIRTRWPNAGIIVTSMNNSTEPNNLPSGVRFIYKPHEGDDLLKAVRELLGEQTGSAS